MQAISLSRSVGRSTPQSGVVSPILGVSGLKPLLRAAWSETNVRSSHMYANELALVLSGEYPQTWCDVAEVTLTKVESWSKEN